MAITLQLQAETTAQNNTGVVQSVTLGAGSRRIFLVGIGAQIQPGPLPTPTVTYGGVPLALVSDGTDIASVATNNAGSTVRIGVFWFRLLESQLPANGAQSLSVSWGGTTVGYAVGWWILENVNQAANIVDVVNAIQNTGGANVVAATLAGGSPSDACLVLGSNRNAAGTLQITIGGVGLAEDFDIALLTSRTSAGTSLAAGTTGTVACDMTYTLGGFQAVVLSCLRFAEFFPTDGQCAMFSAPGSIVTLEAS